jgi:PilZ domain
VRNENCHSENVQLNLKPQLLSADEAYNVLPAIGRFVPASGSASLTDRNCEMSPHQQSGITQTHVVTENRVHPRYKLEVPICIYPRNGNVVRGHTVDVSESGIAAMLLEEVSLGVVVRLEFTVDFGPVEILALVRQRNAFRYGFQFVEAASPEKTLGITLRQLSLDQIVKSTKPL